MTNRDDLDVGLGPGPKPGSMRTARKGDCEVRAKCGYGGSGGGQGPRRPQDGAAAMGAGSFKPNPELAGEAW
jgi:hypothetical protein